VRVWSEKKKRAREARERRETEEREFDGPGTVVCVWIGVFVG
jgi:hypothetical protein